MHFNLQDLPELYNYVEVGLWPTLGLIFLIWGLTREGVVRRDSLIAAITLVFFGASDWFEANTGNEWWHPWWLFLWKAACVLIFLILLIRGYQRKRAAAARRSLDPPAASL